MQDKSFVPFTKEMKDEYTILVPDMLPVHFSLLINVFKKYGYNMNLLTSNGPKVAETGLKYTHNDTCYPAILVIGQFMDALLSGEYDLNKTALIMFQTGGGCRASNYISLIRKALKQADMEQIPVISFSLAGLEKHPGFKLTPIMYYKFMYGILYGDLIMTLMNQVRPYEKVKGSAQKLCDKWTKKLGSELGSSSKAVKYKNVLKNYRAVISDFSSIEREKKDTVKVGIVGEIFVKYSPLANNRLEDFLVSENAEPVSFGLLDFCLYVVYNNIYDYKLYKKKRCMKQVYNFVFKFLCKKRNDMSRLIEENGNFKGFTPFEKVVDMAKDVISNAVKMGEGWLLTAEMIELYKSGCKNIVCTQPFGCLPNHICGKGMMRPIKERYPDANIVAIDFDAGASRVNQENRLKLMLFNAKK